MVHHLNSYGGDTCIKRLRGEPTKATIYGEQPFYKT
jgi:hypothetical protein